MNRTNRQSKTIRQRVTVGSVLAMVALLTLSSCAELYGPFDNPVDLLFDSGTDDDTTPDTDPGGSVGRRILFVSDRDGDDEILTMTADGRNVEQLTSNAQTDTSPVWSPDGEQILFVSNRDGDNEVFVMNADGSGQTQLTLNNGDDHSPRWSPDGLRIVFVSDRDGDEEIMVMNADGSAQTALTSNTVADIQPEWQPGGSRIVYASKPESYDMEIMAVNADGSGVTQLTSNGNADAQPLWSPSGDQIAFISDRNLADYEVYVMNADGSAQTRVTVNSVEDLVRSWSNDGTRIGFVRMSGGTYDAYSIGADGSNEVRVTTNTSSHDFGPFYGQGEDRILLITSVGGNYEIAIANPDGSNVQVLTDNSANDTAPAWQPRIYSVGDAGPAGGVIFYDKGSYSDGWRFLEAAPQDQVEYANPGIVWDPNATDNVSGSGTAVAGTTTQIGAGESNTELIVSAFGSAAYAVRTAADLELGGYSDWFLPSRDELAEMHAQRSFIGNLSGIYWSSSDESEDRAWGHRIDDDQVYNWGKAGLMGVRAIRAF